MPARPGLQPRTDQGLPGELRLAGGRETADRSLLAVLAHPDDESYRLGGTLALLARAGGQVHLLTATRGEAGATGEPPLCSAAELAAWRERELRQACATLGIEPPLLLDYADGSLATADGDRLVEQILDIVREIRPQVMVSFGPDGLSGHPDHIAIGRCAAAAWHRAEGVAALYTVAVPASLVEELALHQLHGVPDAAIALAVGVSAVWEAKLAAIRCHATQLGASPIMGAPEERQHRFLGVEHFVRRLSRREADFLPHALKGHLL